MPYTENRCSMLEGLREGYPTETSLLAQVFNNTTNSYKFLWFLAILSLIQKRQANPLEMDDVFTEMATIAWHPVCLFHLSLGRQDTFQALVSEIQATSRLPPKASSKEVREFVQGASTAKRKLKYFKRHVPTRFLMPWFASRLSRITDNQRDRLIPRLAAESQSTSSPSLYWLENDSIKINGFWWVFLVKNMGVIQGFAEYQFTKNLQARNPNVPGVVSKIHAPTDRQLSGARQFWHFVRVGFERACKSKMFRDIYSDRELNATFTIDHFLPWSFVTHDLLWNLAPVETTTNSKKGDVLPDLRLYLPRLAKLHFAALMVAQKRPKLLEDYTDCFKLDTSALLALGEKGLLTKYTEVMVPQTQIAINQGFRSGWMLND